MFKDIMSTKDKAAELEAIAKCKEEWYGQYDEQFSRAKRAHNAALKDRKISPCRVIEGDVMCVDDGTPCCKYSESAMHLAHLERVRLVAWSMIQNNSAALDRRRAESKSAPLIPEIAVSYEALFGKKG